MCNASRNFLAPLESKRASSFHKIDHAFVARANRNRVTLPPSATLTLCAIMPQVSELGPYRLLVEEAHDLISAHSTDINAVFTFASGGFDRLLGMDPAVRCCFHRVSGGKAFSCGSVFSFGSFFS